MTSALKSADMSGVLVPVVDEVPRISDAERVELLESLKEASADIAAGNFDVLTPQFLRMEFDKIMAERDAPKA